MGKHTNGYDPNIGRPEGFPDRDPNADKKGCPFLILVGLAALGGVGTAIWGVVEAAKAVFG